MGLPARDAMTLLDHGETDRLGQVALARPGRPLQEPVLVLGHEPAGDELEHEPASHLPVEVESKVSRVFPRSRKRDCSTRRSFSPFSLWLRAPLFNVNRMTPLASILLKRHHGIASGL